MSKVNEERRFAIEMSSLMTSIRKVASSFGWRVMVDEPSRITIKEEFANLTSGTWAAELAISVVPDGDGSEMTINGSIFGYGPIQKNHLKGQVGRFLTALTTTLESSQTTTTNDSGTSAGYVADEIKKLGELQAQGLISPEEFAIAKAKLLG
jgi:hypothetical protein